MKQDCSDKIHVCFSVKISEFYEFCKLSMRIVFFFLSIPLHISSSTFTVISLSFVIYELVNERCLDYKNVSKCGVCH